MLTKVVLAGGSGYIGRVLTDFYKDKAKEVVILSRKGAAAATANSRTVLWDTQNRGDWEQELNGADLVVNLCGKNVNCRYTEENKAEIFRSRLAPTAVLGKAIAEAVQPPACWIQVTSATIYRHAEDREQDEDRGDIGAGFSVDVCKAWEAVFWQAETPHTRKVVLRAGIVLGRAGGAFPHLERLVSLGLGGHQGSGQQMVSWVHEQDLARITEWIARQPQTSGVYNGTAPGALTNRRLMKLIRESSGLPFGLPTPQWLLGIGAKLIGTETELVLKSRWVYPKRLLEQGFCFQFPEAAEAVHEIFAVRT